MHFTKQHLTYLLTGFVFFCLFVLFSFLVSKDLFTAIDFDTTVRLQDKLPIRVVPLFSLFSVFGHFEVMLILLVGFFVVMRKWVMGLIAFSLFGFFHVLELFGKVFVDHPPPPFFMLRTEHTFDFPQFYVRTESSYPSGHSGRTVFLAVLFIFFLWKAKRISKPLKMALILGIVGYVFIMLLSRVYLGEHWLTDVIGGSLLALAFSLASLTFSHVSLRKSVSKKDTSRQREE